MRPTQIDAPRGSRSWSSGGGPTGVEMAGQIGELARDTLRGDFRAIDPRSGRILLIEAADRAAHELPAVALGARRSDRSSASA